MAVIDEFFIAMEVVDDWPRRFCHDKGNGDGEKNKAHTRKSCMNTG